MSIMYIFNFYVKFFFQTFKVLNCLNVFIQVQSYIFGHNTRHSSLVLYNSIQIIPYK